MGSGRRQVAAGRLAAALVAAGLVVACTAAPARRSGGAPATAGGTSAGPRPTAPAAAGFVRTCESSVYGELEDGWRRESLAVGPLHFVYLRAAAEELAAEPPSREELLYGRKTLITVDGGASVTVTVPPADRRHVSLLYDPASWKDSGTYRVADGDPVVTFQGCPPGRHPYGADHTQFNGSLLVDGPRCVTFQVSTPAWRAPKRVTVSFGAGRCRP